MLNLSFNKIPDAANSDGSTSALSRFNVWRTAVLGAVCVGIAGSTALAESKPAARPASPVTGDTLAERYCANIIDEAQDARFAWQAKTIADMEKELDKRIALLNEKSAELKSWIERREEFLKLANDGLVEIYSTMRADAAAPQLAAMNEVTAAAIVMKLPPKVASAVLAEMEADKAARMTATIAGAGRMAKRKQGGES
jgi:flagellar motility protein MotE (MotC chaperone)